MIWKSLTVLGLAALIVFSATYVSGSFNSGGEWGSITRPYRFDLIKWEFNNLFDKWFYKIEQLFHEDELAEKDRAQLVEDYISLDQQIKQLQTDLDRAKISGALSAGAIADREIEINSLTVDRDSLESLVEEIIENQIDSILSDEGLSTTLKLGGSISFVFPPVDFAFDERLNVLIISPRDRIDSIETSLLRPNMTLEEKINVELEVEETGYSALVEQVGAVATYPSTVPRMSSIEHLLSKVAHEWVHHYLFFRPLGQKYWANYDMTTINETIANIAGREIGALAYERYYSRNVIERHSTMGNNTEPVFDFNKEMRETRITVDELLEQGEIDKAEQYMNERRQLLEDNGYYIRKLNQAYFAFHGTYADTPTSVNPIGGYVRDLREQSKSLGDFIRTASRIDSYDDLLTLVDG